MPSSRLVKKYKLQDNNTIVPQKSTVVHFWNMHSEQIYKQCLRRINDHDLVDDAMQEIFIKLYCHSSYLENHANPTAWLFLVAKNQCLDYIRRRTRRGYMLFRDLPQDYITDTADPYSDDKKMERSILLTQVQKDLSTTDKWLLQLHYVNGFSLNELAKMFNVSKSTIAKKMIQSMRFLRDRNT
jgi:RNA polymerase sigma-70 factor (ECF subfamily)